MYVCNHVRTLIVQINMFKPIPLVSCHPTSGGRCYHPTLGGGWKLISAFMFIFAHYNAAEQFSDKPCIENKVGTEVFISVMVNI